MSAIRWNMLVRVILCFLFIFLPLPSLDLWFYGQYFKIRGLKQTPTNIVLIHVNDTQWLKQPSKEGLGAVRIREALDLRARPAAWDPDFYDGLLKKIQLFDPKLVVFTTFYDTPKYRSSPAIRDPNVIFSAILNEENKLISPPLELASGENYGFSNLFPDSDNVVRRAYLVYASGGSLALKVYHYLFTEPINRDLIEPMWIDFRGPVGSYPVVDMREILEDKTDKKQLAGKIVLIGREGSRLTDFLTPFNGMSALEIQANIIDTFLGGREIQHPHRWIRYLFSMFIVLCSVLLILNFPLKMAWFLLLLLSGSVLLITELCFSHLKFWLGSANPIICIFGSHLVLLGYKLSRQEELQWRAEQETKVLREMDRFKSNFISLFSHDLKTPIAKVKAIAERLLMEYPGLPDAVKLSLGGINRTNDELARLISDILKVTKMESHSIEPMKDVLDLNHLVEEALLRLKFQAEEKQIQLVLDLEPLFSMEGDQQLLREVITNLIENAIKYSPNGKKVIVRTREAEGTVSVVVIDEGFGISPDELPKVTGKFFRGRKAMDISKGTGLGLYLAKYFVELHQGSLDIKSELGRGTEVRFTLPIGT